jgi:hypothetical protein
VSDQLTLRVALDLGPEADPETAERALRLLRDELRALDVDSVGAERAGPPPPGAKGDAASATALLVALSASGGVAVTVLEAVRDWLRRRSGGGRVVVEYEGRRIELEAATAAQQRDLVTAFAAQVTAAQVTAGQPVAGPDTGS